MAGSFVEQVKPTQAAAPDAPQPGNRKPKTALVFGAVILGVVCLQVVVTSLLVPRPAHSPANQKHAGPEPAAQGRPGSEHDAVDGEFAEVALGDFSFSNTTALRGAVTHVDFRLVALAASSKASTLDSQIKSNQGRIRESVNKVVRNCNLDELNDPNLDTIKRQVRDEINGLLGKTLVVEVMINDFRIIQQ